mmetsp:Transcript_24975/g.25189  ORF Transcript_24975/g.25189 Transcript_24975/m.25189 type:complete len:212 (-) Transcript_24975:81-716(-)|eukprot:CAMPEP_0182428018 /NCGR_PEP_ID=MMETSP1167-20130531/20957_1 /TAXON_ID=2988 /ORGANISM="Mallomonas Sp, Strain CCMP3275" /LENGTH=211 /DNA_ID=CAMNT_0024610643 /DNA_START=33 /DNA_END=668 /DNA_ORIENTATION=-
MAPHGPGFTGATHSHNPEYPDDDWNLYTQIDVETVQGLNVTTQPDVVGIFKPFALRLNEIPSIFSDADEEIMINVRFISPVHIRKIMVIGGGESEAFHPRNMKCYVNYDAMDFTSLDSVRPAQEFDLPINNNGSSELITAIHPFTNVNMVSFYFPSNHGDIETTSIRYIGMQGEHTHYRREAVNTNYELLCTHQDITQREESKGSMDTGMR